jgi:putative tryptophan/tyrosine transport system substrate-binding protein
MRRRDIIAGLGGAAMWPLAARAQQTKMRRIGVLNGFDNATSNSVRVPPFKKELQTLGWVEGRNIQIDYREVPNLTELDAAAAALVASKPEVILVMPTPAIEAILRATRSIPVVFANTVDPVEGGFVTSIAHPGGNATGFTSMEYSLGGKWLELLKEFAPATARVLVLFIKENYTSRGLLRSIEIAAQSHGVQITAAPVRDAGDISRAFASFGGKEGGGLLTPPHTIITNHNRHIFKLATENRLPAVYPFRQYAVAGGLVSYGTVEAAVYRRAAGYVDRILKGEQPGHLPVQNPDRFELVVNLQAARAIGLNIPSSLLIRADEVIE